MEQFITGAELLKRWGMEKQHLMGIIQAWNINSDNIVFSNVLRPYSPAYQEPYECWNPLLRDAHKRAGTQYTPPPWSVERPGDLYDVLPEVLFKKTDVETYEAVHRPKSKSKFLWRHENAVLAGKLVKKTDNPDIIYWPDALKMINDILIEGELKPYCSKRLREILKDEGVEFPDAKRGPKTKK
jgi:hypothetical protein